MTLPEAVVRYARIADAAALLFAMTGLIDQAGAAEGDVKGLAHQSLAAKVLCSEGAWEIADRAVQLNGGAGFVEDSGVPLLLRDARITRIFEGANDVLLIHMGTLMAFGGINRHRLGDGAAGARADALQQRVAEFCTKARKDHGVHLARRPRVLHRLGTLSVLGQAADAAVLRARAVGGDEPRALAEHWVSVAERRAAPLFGSATQLSDVEAIARQQFARAT